MCACNAISKSAAKHCDRLLGASVAQTNGYDTSGACNGKAAGTAKNSRSLSAPDTVIMYSFNGAPTRCGDHAYLCAFPLPNLSAIQTDCYIKNNSIFVACEFGSQEVSVSAIGIRIAVWTM
jgi:hypothetical protein